MYLQAHLLTLETVVIALVFVGAVALITALLYLVDYVLEYTSSRRNGGERPGGEHESVESAPTPR